MALLKNEVKLSLGIAGAIAIIVIAAMYFMYTTPWYVDKTPFEFIVIVGLIILGLGLFSSIFHRPSK